MNKILTIVFLSINLLTFSQVQWAEELVSVSSTYVNTTGDYSYKAIQALGKPSVLPTIKEFSVVAWSPQTEDSKSEFIHVKFSSPQVAAQIIVNENYNPGSIVQIELFDTQMASLIVLKDSLGFKNSDGSKALVIQFPMTTKPVSSARITMNTSLVPGYNQLDAVGISGNSKPIEIAVEAIKSDNVMFTKERLANHINSTTSELLPVISVDGETLFFVREGHPLNINNYTQHVWYASIVPKDSLDKAVYLPAPINNNDNNGVCSITPDGQSLLLLNKYNADGTMGKGVSMSKKDGNAWGFPETVEIEDFYNDNNYGEYALLNDGRTLLITTQRKEGFGSKDVQVCFKKEDGTWTKPKNLGPIINTPASETSPFMASDGTTLYFASKGHLGYGNTDLFMATRLDDTWTNWSEPINLGPTINTPKFDAYYTIPAKGDYAYFVNYTDTSGADVFRIKLPASAKPKPVALIKGHVYDAETKKPLSSQINYESLVSGKVMGVANSNKTDGFYSIALPGGDFYGFQASAANYYPLSQNLDLRKLNEYQEKGIDLFLFPLKVGQKVKLNNVFFDTGKFSFRKETYVELDRLVQFLKENTTTVIRIDGHTDNQGEDASNMSLSNNRAKAVYDYLISKGVQATQLSFKGFGETAPVDANTTETGRQNNRRVEFLIEKI